MARSKTCFKCKKEMPIKMFYKHKGMADGHLNKCIDCTKNDVHAYRLKNIDACRAYDRERAKRPERIKLALITNARWRKADRRRGRAHNAVSRAIRSGKLIPKQCEWPGCKSEHVLAHHEDYNKPLDVVWYCQPHHKKRHAQMRKEGIDP